MEGGPLGGRCLLRLTPRGRASMTAGRGDAAGPSAYTGRRRGAQRLYRRRRRTERLYRDTAGPEPFPRRPRGELRRRQGASLVRPRGGRRREALRWSPNFKTQGRGSGRVPEFESGPPSGRSKTKIDDRQRKRSPDGVGPWSSRGADRGGARRGSFRGRRAGGPARSAELLRAAPVRQSVLGRRGRAGRDVRHGIRDVDARRVAEPDVGVRRPSGDDIALSFKRTTPAFRRRKSQPERCDSRRTRSRARYHASKWLVDPPPIARRDIAGVDWVSLLETHGVSALGLLLVDAETMDCDLVASFPFDVARFPCWEPTDCVG